MNLCKLLGFPDRSCRRCRNIQPREDSGLRCVIKGSLPPSDRGDPGAWGLHDSAAAGPTDGLGLCTESLGSESCDTGVVADVANFEEEAIPARSPRKSRRSFSSAAVKRKGEKFPPPLPWLSESGRRRTCFMKGEKKEGRFLLKEVRIERPEVLRASRQNGRLRLHLIELDSSDCGEDLKAFEEEEEEERGKEEGEVEERVEVVRAVRCQEAVSGTMWWKNQPFVTTA